MKSSDIPYIVNVGDGWNWLWSISNVGFDVSGAEPSGSVTKKLINHSFIGWIIIG
jgi:hypothetical protein